MFIRPGQNKTNAVFQNTSNVQLNTSPRTGFIRSSNRNNLDTMRKSNNSMNNNSEIGFDLTKALAEQDDWTKRNNDLINSKEYSKLSSSQKAKKTNELSSIFKSYKYLNSPEFQNYLDKQTQAEKNKGNAFERFGSRLMDSAMISSSPEVGHGEDIKADTGNKIANFVADAIGTVTGYATPTGFENSVLGVTNKIGQKVADKVAPKVITAAGKSSFKNVILRNILEGAATTAPLSFVDANKEKLSAGDTAKKVAIDTALGAGIGAGVGILGKGFSMLKDAIRKPIQEVASSTDVIPLEKIIKPKMAPGKLKLSNPEYNKALSDYNSAIEAIQSHFKTNELRAAEIPLIKDQLGINLDEIVTRMEQTQNKTLSSAENLRMKRVSGAASKKNYDLIDNLKEQPKTEIRTTENKTLSPERQSILQNVIDNPDKFPADMVQRAKTELNGANTNIAKGKSTHVNSEIKIGEATWKNKDYDQPIKVTGDYGIGKDGRRYIKVEGSTMGVPLDEIQYTRKPINKTKTGTSKFAQTVKDADATDKAFAETIRPPKYQKVENQPTWDNAVKTVSKNSDEVYSRIKRTGNFKAKDTAESMVLIDKLSREGKFEQANEILEHATKKLTESGQAIQAAAMWARQTPSGMLRYAENVTQKARNAMVSSPEMKALTDEIDSLKSQIDEIKANKTRLQEKAKTVSKQNRPGILKQINDLDNQMRINLQLFAEKEARLPAKYKNVKLTESDTAHIFKEQSEISKMIEGKEKTQRVAQLQAFIGRKIPSSVLQKISTVQTMAQLMNFKTAIRNTVGNAGFAVLENGSDVLATGFDSLLSKVTGQRTKAFGLDSIKAQGRGFKKGFAAGVDDALKGIDTSGMKSQFDLPTKTFKGTFKNTGEMLHSGQYKNAIAEGTSAILSGLEKGMQIELKATDRAFYQAAFNKTIAEQMRVQGIKSLDGITDDILEMAHLDGLYRTFQDKNILSKGFSGFKKLLNGGKEFGVGDFVMKYPKTPANLIARGIDYSPIAIVRSMVQLGKIIAKTNKYGGVTAQTQKKFVEGLARGTIGSGLFFGASAMYNSGILQGKSPKDKEAAKLLKEVGQGQYTFNTDAFMRWVSSGFDSKAAKAQEGDKSFSYDWLQPQALSIAAGANRAEQLKNKGKVNALDTLGAIVYSLESGVDTLAEQPLVQGVANLFKGYGSVSDNVKNVFQSAPASFIPTFVNQTKQIIDNKSRVVESDGHFGLDKALNLVMNKIPGLSSKLPEQITTTGNIKETYQNGSNDWYNVLFNPAFVSTLKKTPGLKVVLDLYSETGDTKQFPRESAKNFTINGKKLQLTSDQRNELQKFVGQKTIEILDKVAKQPSFDKLTSQQKIKAIENVLDSAGNQGRSYLLKKLGGDYIKKNLKK